MKEQPADFRASERSQTLRRTYLYHFKYDSTHYYYCAYDEDLTLNGGPVAKMSDPQVFTAAQIGHSNIEESMESAPRAVAVTLSATDAALREYFISVSPKVIEVEIWRVSSAALPGDLEYDEDVRMCFRGEVDSISFDDVSITVNCVTLLLQEARTIPQFHYQRMCNHQLYSEFCGVNKALFNVSVSLSALNRPALYVQIPTTSINVGSPARAVTVTEETFQGGYIEDALGNKIGILVGEVLPAAAGTRLYLNYLPLTLANGATVTVYCGCLYIKRVCHEMFNNLPNFGGTPYVPKNNPAVDGINV